jgi:hypothetical protein
MRLSSLASLQSSWSAYGLRFAQEAGQDADVRLTFARVPIRLGESVLSSPRRDVAPGDWLLRLSDGSRIRARSGNRIEIDAPPSADGTGLAAWVLGPATTAILYQRGITPLHASAVEVNGGVVAFLAPSGTGKSSLAAAFVANGAPLVTDDVLAIRLGHAGTAHAWPGAEGLRLAPATRAHFSGAGFTLLRQDADDKQLIAAPTRVPEEPLPVRLLVLLARGGDLRIERIAGLDLLMSLRRLLQRPSLVAPLGAEAAVFRVLGWLAARVPTYRLVRPAGGWTLPACYTLVKECLATSPYQPTRQGSLHAV